FPFCARHADVGRHAGGFSKACGSASPLPSPSHYVAPGGGLAPRQIRNAPTVSVPLGFLGGSTNSLSLFPSINASFAHPHEADPMEALAHVGQRQDISPPGEG